MNCLYGIGQLAIARETLNRTQMAYLFVIFRASTLLIALVLICPLISHTSLAEALPVQNPLIVDMIQKIDQGEIYNTVYSLQNCTTRYYGYPGNTEAATWLYNKLSSISGLKVEYQGGEIRNVIATLPGLDKTSSDICIVGAHYDSENSADLSDSPGATDNGGGVAIVLELARIMSQYTFNHTIIFALWNAEEGGASKAGSSIYADYATANKLNISLYFNFDSSCYDPDNRFVLDIMYNNQSQWVSDIMTQDNSIYEIGFNLTYNVHITHESDHRTFWDHGYTAVMTHEESHGPAHSKYDTIDKVSTPYAKKNGQLGMSVLAEISEVLAHADQTTTVNSILTIGILIVVIVVITLGILMFRKRKLLINNSIFSFFIFFKYFQIENPITK